MYYLTDQDPNYTIKGSRDPLGFQVIWQAAGRKLIPYLSTVSNSIKDFQILSLAFALKQELKIDDKQFEPFFLRFEQMMAYTRFKANSKEGFNGVDKVKKIMSGDLSSVRISTAAADQLLSNQKAYGIWGKYNSPFTEMKISELAEFRNVYLPKIESIETFLHQSNLLSKKRDAQVAYIEINKMDEWTNLLKKPTGEEKRLFVEKLLDDTCDKELLKLINANPDYRGLDFFQLIEALSNTSNNANFKAVLKFIVNTEKVLSPLNHIFRYLQTRSYWKYQEIEKDDYIKKWRTAPDISGFDDTSRLLAGLLRFNNVELVRGLITRNEDVSARRNSAPWISATENGIAVNHFEGAFLSEDYDPENDNDNNYFISTFIKLHKELN